MNQDSFEKELIRLGFVDISEDYFRFKFLLFFNDTSIIVEGSRFIGSYIIIINTIIVGVGYDNDIILSIINNELRSIKLKKLLNE